MFSPASIPLQQRHQKHLKIAPGARAPCQLSCCPLPAPPLRCCSVEAQSSLPVGQQGWLHQENPTPAACPREWQLLSCLAAAPAPGDIRGCQCLHHFSWSLRRAGGLTYVTTGCPQQEGHTELSELWETPVVEISQPGAVSYLFAGKWRGQAPGKRAQSISPCSMLCSIPSPSSAAAKSITRMWQC